MLPQNRVLVTGGSGFPGSHLCRRLLEDGHYVLCVDNVFTSSRQLIQPFLYHENFEFLRHDISGDGLRQP